MSAVLGVDPGLRGAAVLREPFEVPVFWACWTPVAAGFRVTFARREVREVVEIRESFEALGALLVQLAQPLLRPLPYPVPARCPVVFESCFEGQTLIASADELLSAISPMASRFVRPLANDRRRGRRGWREVVLSLPNSTKANVAEDYALARARREGWLPRVSVAEQGAIAEAGAMADFEAAREAA